jgi:hypothetical protein
MIVSVSSGHFAVLESITYAFSRANGCPVATVLLENFEMHWRDGSLILPSVLVSKLTDRCDVRPCAHSLKKQIIAKAKAV